MKGIYFDVRLPRALMRMAGIGGKNVMLRYRENAERPRISDPGEVIIKNIMSGICGTDTRILDMNVSRFGSIITDPSGIYPMGHEIIGQVEEVGDNVRDLVPGDRVVVNPLPHCDARGFARCPACEIGMWSQCGSLAGRGDGSESELRQQPFGGTTNGGFCEYSKAFEKQLYKIPDNIPERTAVLLEPLAVGVHAAAGIMPGADETVLVIGAGTIGLVVIAALRELGFRSRIICSARYSYQAEMALQMGADEVICRERGDSLKGFLAKSTGAVWYKPPLDPDYVFGADGPDVLIDTIASEDTMRDDIRMIRSGGRIAMLGMHASYTRKVDWGVLFFKDIQIKGIKEYGMDTLNGRTQDSFQWAIEIMSENPEKLASLVTHTFRLSEYKKALNLMRNKSPEEAVKIVFDYR